MLQRLTILTSSLMYFSFLGYAVLSVMFYQQMDNIPSILLLSIVLSVRMPYI